LYKLAILLHWYSPFFKSINKVRIAAFTNEYFLIQKFLLYDEVVTSSKHGTEIENTIATLGGSDKMDASGDTEIVMNSALSEKTFSAGDGVNMDVAANKNGISIMNVTARWTEDLPENTLTNVSLEVRPGGLLAVIGPVGSGKVSYRYSKGGAVTSAWYTELMPECLCITLQTSLLHAILKELPLSSGSISVGGSVSYASQEPWLFTASVRQNIWFGQPLDRNRYRQVVRVCALEQDFQQLPHGDKTIVGERGATLSGGQRARINLAR
jgi:ABC-type multidrug transport system fused ATPase/permease subunit